MFSFGIRGGFLPYCSPCDNGAQAEFNSATLLCTRQYNNIDRYSRHKQNAIYHTDKRHESFVIYKQYVMRPLGGPPYPQVRWGASIGVAIQGTQYGVLVAEIADQQQTIAAGVLPKPVTKRLQWIACFRIRKLVA